MKQKALLLAAPIAYFPALLIFIVVMTGIWIWNKVNSGPRI